MSVITGTISGEPTKQLSQIRSFFIKNWRISDKKTKKRWTIWWNKYSLIVVIIAEFNWFFLAWSFNYLDVAVASIIFQIWIVIFVLFRHFSQKEKEISLSRSIWILFSLSLLGVIYITLSHNNIISPFNIKGLLLIGITAILGGARVERSLNWAEQMTKKMTNKKEMTKHQWIWIAKEDKEKIGEWEFTWILLALIIASISNIILITIGKILLVTQGIPLNLQFAPNDINWFANELGWIICIIGGFTTAIGRWSLRKGNLITSHLDINGIYYLNPVVSLVWLISLGLTQLERWNYFIIGALIIIATSILIGIEARTNRQGFRWLIISLWSMGLLVYFREKWINWPWLADGTPWEWSTESVDYYSLIVLSATIFILILSFRTSRLIDRTNSEKAQYLEIMHVLDNIDHIDTHKFSIMPYLVKKLKKDVDQIDQYPTKNKKELGEIDEYETKHIGEILNNFCKNLNIISQTNYTNKEIRQSLDKLKLNFKLLCQSKQRGRYLAENLVLYIFSLVTVMVTIGTRPPVNSNWNALITDILAFLFASAICFMTINLVDLQLYRERPTGELIKYETRTMKGHKSDDYINQMAVQIISIILAIVISLSFIVLLYDKWMGIWFI